MPEISARSVVAAACISDVPDLCQVGDFVALIVNVCGPKIDEDVDEEESVDGVFYDGPRQGVVLDGPERGLCGECTSDVSETSQ